MEDDSHWLNRWGIPLVCIAGAMLLLLSISPLGFGRTTPQARAVMERSNVKVLLLGCRAYAADNEGKYPPQLSVLYPDYIDIRPLFEGRDENGKNKLPMIYYPGLTATSDPKAPVIKHPFTFDGKKITAYVSGHVTEEDVAP